MPALELALDPVEMPRLAKLPGLRGGRTARLEITWHDTADGALQAAGLSLASQSGQWRLERLGTAGPGQVPTQVAEAPTLAGLGAQVPDGVAIRATLTGQRRTLRRGEVAVHLCAGTPPAGRIVIEGPAGETAALAHEIAAALPVHVPRASLAAQVMLVPAAMEAPEITAGQDAAEALAAIVARLTDEMLRWPGQMDGAGPEPVHQMRVATRRLRSALTVFRPVAAGEELETLRTGLHGCATTLGGARDWDVFLAGTAARLAAAFPEERRVRTLLRAAQRRRLERYAALRAYLDSAAFRCLAVGLAGFAALRAWPAGVEQSIGAFAAEALTKRAKRVRRAGRGIDELPIEALHELRKNCKRLRYTAEFFSSLYPPRPVRRYVKRLAGLQEELGRLNDGAAVAGLIGQLGRAEGSYVGGLVEGFAAAHSVPMREEMTRAWRRFREADRFWID